MIYTKNRIYSLDFLRVIATILIVMHHYQQLMHVYFDGSLNFYGDDFYFGYIVEFFFILSCFFCKMDKNVELKEYMMHRCHRLLPLLTISVIVYEVLIYIYGCLGGSQWLFDNKIDVWGTVITALGLQAGGVFSNPMINSPTWYISVLLLCYLLYHIATSYAFKHNYYANIVYIIIIILSIGITTYDINLPFINATSSRGYISFFVGILLHEGMNTFNDRHKKGYIISVLLVICLTWCMIYHLEWMKNGLNYILIFIYFPCIVHIFTSKAITRIFNFRVFGLLGKISYDVYIWHCPFFLFCYILVELGVKLNFARYRYMLLYTCCAYAIGTVSYFFLDRPITKTINKHRIKEYSGT